jgi:hypothetical protein
VESSDIIKRDTLTIRWVPEHSDIKIADKPAKDISENLTTAVKHEPNIMRFISISHLRVRAQVARLKWYKSGSMNTPAKKSPTYDHERQGFAGDWKGAERDFSS